MPSHRSIVIFSGGTAANHLVDVFESIRKSKDCPLSYVIPISDNGGSSSELIRVFGGPGIGDVRSRLVRLIPRLPQGSPGFKEREGIRALFNYRLSSTDARAAKMQWADVVDGTSHLWKDISSAKKELIRSFFNLVNSEITKRSRPPSSTFDFTSASVGNLFLTGARLFSGSFESAIYLLGSICGIEDEGVKVIPSINSNFSHHIAAGLEDGSVIVGQNAISHPSLDVGVTPLGAAMAGVVNSGNLSHRPSGMDYYYDNEHEVEHEQQQEEEDAHLPGTLPTLRTKNITFNKDAHSNAELSARISRIWYINPYGQEILPPANPRAVQALNNAQAIIYSIGSLYTSLIPSLVLRGVGDALRRNTSAAGTGLRTKILILNGCLDREVGPQPPHSGAQGITFSAVDFIEAIVRAGEQSRGVAWEGESQDISDVNTFERSSTNSSSTSAVVDTSLLTKPRPGLLSSKSEGILRTSLNQPKSYVHAMAHRQQHLFPPPLLASTANSRTPSRTPSREPSPSASPNGTPANTDPDTLQVDSNTALRSNSTIDALNSLPSATTTSNPSTHTHNHHFSIHHPSAHSPHKYNQNRSTIYNNYITHLIHLPNHSTTPFVDKDLLSSKYGIQTIRVYGRSDPDGNGMRYDPAALRGAIEAILGRRAERENGDRNRPNTVDGAEAEDKAKKVETTKGVLDKEREWSWNKSGLGRRNTLDG